MTEGAKTRLAAHDRASLMVNRLAELVMQESPPGCLPELKACADLLEEWGSAALGRRAKRVVVDGLTHLLWPARQQEVLLLGHYDTVWPSGTTEDWPFALQGEIATGPGVCDMKAGLVQMITALELLDNTSRVGLLLTCDEETGSASSRSLIEQQAARSRAVLVCEPSAEDGSLKVARKGGSMYTVNVAGRAAHAGAEPHRGVNATVELAHQILRIRQFGDDSTTVTPTMMSAGTMSNMVPDQAQLCVDVRAWTRAELERVDGLIRGLRPHLDEAGLLIGGGISRYPLQAETNKQLLAMAHAAGERLGLQPFEAVAAAGASDANFTGALGVPTLDGLGGVGGGSHARSEYVNVGYMPDRTALLAELIHDCTSARTAGRRDSKGHTR